MRSHHSLTKDQDANAAAWEAGKGALWGATKWGIPCFAFAVIGYHMSPVYRNLTIQFKVFLQMSGMSLGGYLEADHRVRLFEQRVRIQKRAERDHAVWRKWGGLVDEKGEGAGRQGVEGGKRDR